MTTFAKELRQAWRSLLQRKAYFLTCAATLTLVLGANAAMFAVVNATMLRPMPFATRGEVLHLFVAAAGHHDRVCSAIRLQQMDLPQLRERARTLARLEGFLLSERVVTLNGEPGVAQAAAVTPGLLPMMAAPVGQGRSFLESEAQPGHFVALVTDRYWRDTLGSASILGTALVIDGQPHTIVGILSPSFAVPFIDAQIFTPLYANPEPQPRAPPLSVVTFADWAPGASSRRLATSWRRSPARCRRSFRRTHNGWIHGAQTAREWQYGSMRAPLLMLFAATAFVLLIACVNIANLTSAQAIARVGRVVAPHGSRRLPERDVVAHPSRRAVDRVRQRPRARVCCWRERPFRRCWRSIRRSPRTLGDVSIDWRVQVFSAVVAILTAVHRLRGAGGSRMRGRISAIVAASRHQDHGSSGAARAQRALVSLEVALCVALLMAGGVVIKGLRDLSQRGPGYDSTAVLTAQIRLPDAAYKDAALRAATVKRMLDGIRALPGVDLREHDAERVHAELLVSDL